MPTNPSSTLRAALSGYSAVILTGGSSGIGKSFMGLLQTPNPKLWICNLSRRVPDMISDELRLRHFPCDLAELGSIPDVIVQVLSVLKEKAPAGKIMLINNSGFGGYGLFPEPGVEHQLGMIDVNIRAVVELTGRLMPELKKRGGAVFNIASTAAFQPTAFLATYGATKSFVRDWSLALREELRGAGVAVVAVCPGPTGTEFFKRAGLVEGAVSNTWGQTSAEVALQALEAWARGRGLVVTGWKNKIMTAFMGLLPRTWAARLAAAVLRQYRLKQSGQ